jgi:hypothetical protein
MAKTPANSTQEHLPIAGIQDDVIIMADGSVRAVLKVEPINFELKSEQEQNGIIYSYQAFLNSLEYPIQIIVQSKKLDLERYLVKLEGRLKLIDNELLRLQTEDYIDFVRRLISVANIMSKRFYVVVKYAALEKQGGVGFLNFTSLFHKAPTGPIMEQAQFERYRAEATSRASSIGGGLARLGMRVNLMETQSLIELFYATYNPDIAAEERLTGMDNLNPATIASPQIKATPDTPAPQPTQPVPTPPSEPANVGDELTKALEANR